MKKLLCTIAAATMLAAPVLAGEKPPAFVVSGYVADKPEAIYDPTQALIMLRSDVQVPLYLMKVPSAEDQAAYDKLRAAAFQEAREKYLKKQAAYDKAVKAAAGMAMRPELPAKPVEPTEANFEFTPFGLMAAVQIGPMNRFAKGEGGASTYLQHVTPGEYRIYGPIVVGPNGMMGMCFCMGSVKFEARPGEITDLGVILARTTPVARPPAGDSSAPILITVPNYLGPAPAGMSLDPRLAKLTVRRAEYHPAGKLPNYFGVTVARIPEMPGVMRYERDRIVDLTGSH